MSNCFICNSQPSSSSKSPADLLILRELMKSGRSLLDLLQDILEEPLHKNGVHSKLLCMQCHAECVEYDEALERINNIKCCLMEKFKNNKTDVCESDNVSSQQKETIVNAKIQKRLVSVPVSKLQPLPPNYVIKLDAFGGLVKSSLNPKTITSSLASTQTAKTTLCRIVSSPTKTTTNNMPESLKETLTSNTLSVTNNKINNLYTTQHESGSIDYNNIINSMPSLDDIVPPNQDIVTNNVSVNIKREKDVNNDLSVPVNGDHLENEEKCVMETDEETILVEDLSEGSLFHVVSSERFVYSEADGEISVITAPEENDSNNNDSEDEEESQIELQMSGDEETAKAIIEAAKEEGAFIKVESGEMYRVKSVHSRPRDDPEVEHMQPIVGKYGNLFECLLCAKKRNASTANSSNMQFIGDSTTITSHMKKEHGARVYICLICNRILWKRKEYSAHVASHKTVGSSASSVNKSKLYACTVCEKKYSSRAQLRDHMDLHSGLRSYKCEICQKTFTSKYTHQSHLNTHTNRPRPFKCKTCGKSFLTQNNLTQHEKTHSSVKEFECNVCGKTFGSAHNLEVHGIVHSKVKPFLCGICQKGFARRAEVRDHMRIHTGERPFSCEICGTSFAQRSNLLSHKRATHFNDKRYHCAHCPKRFKRRRLLEYHIKAAHTGERPLVCKLCNATFVYPEHFKKHERIHSGDKPFSCEICGKSFNSCDNRNRHRFVHSDKKPYECVVCEAGFMRKQLLYVHMNTSGHMAESIVVNQPRVTKIQKSQRERVEAQTESGGSVDDNVAATLLSVPIEFEIPGQVQATEHTVLQSVEDANSEDKNQIQMNMEDGLVRLVQVQLPNGNSGWVAINH